MQSMCNGAGCEVALSLLHWVTDEGHYPTATVTVGEHSHSWRTLIAPYCDLATFAREYDFNRPWDAESNLRAASRVSSAFGCGSRHSRSKHRSTDPLDPPKAAYVALVGPDCVIRPEGLAPRKPEDVPGKTIVLVETRLSDIPWTNPFDLPLKRLKEDRAYAESVVGGPHPGGGHFVRADGTRGRINEIGLDSLLEQCVVPDDAE